MKFDINLHIKNHAYYYLQIDTPTDTDLHFKFSILDLYFYTNDYNKIEKKLKEILDDLLEPTKYNIKMKNGFYTDKSGNKKQKYANRKITIDLKKYLTALAIHTKGSKGEYTQPHIHFLIKKDAKLAPNFFYLKHHISKTLEKYNLKAHFDEMDNYKYTNLAKSVSKFFWQLKKQTDREFEKFIAKNPDKLTKYLDLLYSYAKTSNRLDYFFKTMQVLRKRLNKLNIDFEYNNHNLRYSYNINFILENPENKEVIKLLQDKKYAQKDIKSYIGNPILRDAVRFSILDKKGAYIIGEIKHNTKLLDNFKANKTLTNNYLKLLKKELQTTKTKTQLKEQGKLEYIKAFKKALGTAKNEKELREILKEKYDFKFKKRKGKTIGFVFNNTYLSIKDLGFKDISEIRQVLISNNKHTENRSTGLEIVYKTEKNKRNLQKRKEYYQSKKIDVTKLKEIKFLAYKLKIQSKLNNQLHHNIQQPVQLNIKLPDINIKLNTQNLIKGVKNAKQYQSTIRNNLENLERHTRELNKISKRKYFFKNEDKIIRRETQFFGERITKSITNTIETIGNSIKQSIKSRIGRFKERTIKTIRDMNIYYFVKFLTRRSVKILEKIYLGKKNNSLTEKEIRRLEIKEHRLRLKIEKLKNTDEYEWEKSVVIAKKMEEREKLNQQDISIGFKPSFKR